MRDLRHAVKAAELMTAPLAPDAAVRFAHRGAFDAAVLSALSASSSELLLMDRDFHDWPLESVQGEALLAAFLGRHRSARVRLLVHEPDWLERHAPRLARLRRRRPGAFECRQIPDTDFDGSGLMLVDRSHVLRRAHFSGFRGTLEPLAAGQAAALWQRWNGIWQAAADCLPLTTLGL